MTNLNQVQQIPQAVFADGARKLTELEAIFAPYITSLTEKQRKDMLKASNRTASFITKGSEYTQTNPELLPSYLAAGDVRDAMDTHSGLRSFLQSLSTFTGNISDTAMVSAGGTFGMLLKFYNSVKEGARYNVPAARTIYKDLSARFPGRKKKKPLPQQEMQTISENNAEMKAA